MIQWRHIKEKKSTELHYS